MLVRGLVFVKGMGFGVWRGRMDTPNEIKEMR